MILSGKLSEPEGHHRVVTIPEVAQWRAGAARDADAAATTQDEFVDATRRDGVRHAIAVLRGAHHFKNYPPAERRADVARLLATSVEKQARVAGIGRISIAVGGAA